MWMMLFLAQVLRISVPYVLAALGGALSERAGVINLALEGILLSGAFAATLGAHFGGGSFALGLLAGIAGGVLISALYGLCVLRFRANQVVCGVAINLLVVGLTRYLLQWIFGSASNSPPLEGFDSARWTPVFVGGSIALVFACDGLLRRTAIGLRIRATGENPAAAHSLGISVPLVRWVAVLAAGALAGMGGAWLALYNQGFTDNMSGGRGYIALSAMIFGNWNPIGAALACLLFGFADALQIHLQTSAPAIPRELFQVLPYLLTVIALCGALRSSRPPAALGQPFEASE